MLTFHYISAFMTHSWVFGSVRACLFVRFKGLSLWQDMTGRIYMQIRHNYKSYSVRYTVLYDKTAPAFYQHATVTVWSFITMVMRNSSVCSATELPAFSKLHPKATYWTHAESKFSWSLSGWNGSKEYQDENDLWLVDLVEMSMSV